jgi:hypothetical protein
LEDRGEGDDAEGLNQLALANQQSGGAVNAE